MTFFKSLFSNKTKHAKSKYTLSNNFALQVQKSITLLSENEGALSDEEVIRLLISDGIDYNEAIEILLFLPIAFVRNWLPNLKWHNTYNEYNNKKQSERKYSETKSFQIIWDVTKDYFQNAPNADSIIKISGRSAEFHAINQLLNEGCNLKDIKLTKTTIIR